MSKQQPLGVCDHCLGPIPPGQWYTSKSKPRQFCSRDCRNTSNSRAGASIRSQQMKSYVAMGQWENPAKLNPPTPAEQGRRARLGRLREVAAGSWRNPGQTPAARAINSQPRKHTGPLADAIEKLGSGMPLTPEEHEAYRAYRREQQRARWEAMTAEEKSHCREQWRKSKQKRSAGEENVI